VRPRSGRQRVAIVGAGAGGVAAAYFVAGSFDVDLFEILSIAVRSSGSSAETIIPPLIWVPADRGWETDSLQCSLDRIVPLATEPLPHPSPA
jgi:glycine/D-amino acid oxidase-like deaminating enzyme